MDMVGLETIYNIEKLWAEKTQDKERMARVDFYKKNFIDTNKLGMKTGEGFYKYPKPKYKDSDFLS
jgi:3-hydroxybutyryl-CoA dehydrogenase